MFNTFPKARPRLRAVLFGLAVCALSPAVGVGAAHASPGPAQAPLAAPPFVSDRLSVEVVGQGPDLILIPGLASSREVWRATADRLKTPHGVQRGLVAGCGADPWRHGDGAFVQPEVEALARYIREAGLARPAVVGHSLGGLSGLLLAQRHPDLVGRLMTVDSLPFYSAMFGPAATVESARPFARQAAAAIIGADEATYRAQQEATARALSRTPAEQARIVDWSMASDRRATAAAMTDVMTTDARPGLAAMTTPVTALYAADADGGAPAAMADALWGREYAALPDVALIRMDGSRHFIMAEQPERFAERLDAFLAD
jgi:pimeloyl-ACP methyl ester carboxylesterase